MDIQQYSAAIEYRSKYVGYLIAVCQDRLDSPVYAFGRSAEAIVELNIGEYAIWTNSFGEEFSCVMFENYLDIAQRLEHVWSIVFTM